jgi:alpha-beta hydrolase superfamily lysophospholipase
MRLRHYKHLHDAGYNVIAYDLRNHGRSADSMTRSEDVQEIYDNLGSKVRSSSDRGHDSAIRSPTSHHRRCRSHSLQKVNEAYDRLIKSDVKYRFSIDMASLRSESRHQGAHTWQ